MHETHQTVLGRLVGTSVLFNGLCVPISSLQTVLARYVDNLFVWNENSVYKVSLVGSATLVHFSDRLFLLCTNHQLRGHDLQNISIMTRDGEKVITSSGVRHFIDDTDPRYIDLAVFDFTEPCHDFPELRGKFFNLRSVPPVAPSTDVVFFIVSGFPCKDQKYELEEKNHIGKVKRIVICELDHQPTDPTLLAIRATEPLDFDPDGMSGGSAFVVQRVGSEFRAFFAGLVVTGGVDRFRIIKAGHILRFLSGLVAG